MAGGNIVVTGLVAGGIVLVLSAMIFIVYFCGHPDYNTKHRKRLRNAAAQPMLKIRQSYLFRRSTVQNDTRNSQPLDAENQENPDEQASNDRKRSGGISVSNLLLKSQGNKDHAGSFKTCTSREKLSRMQLIKESMEKLDALNIEDEQDKVADNIDNSVRTNANKCRIQVDHNEERDNVGQNIDNSLQINARAELQNQENDSETTISSLTDTSS